MAVDAVFVVCNSAQNSAAMVVNPSSSGGSSFTASWTTSATSPLGGVPYSALTLWVAASRARLG